MLSILKLMLIFKDKKLQIDLVILLKIALSLIKFQLIAAFSEMQFPVHNERRDASPSALGLEYRFDSWNTKRHHLLLLQRHCHAVCTF